MGIGKIPQWCLDQIEAGIKSGEYDEKGRKVEPPPPIDEKAAEKDFQAAVIKRAKELGWLTYHTRDSRKSEEGFPDLVLVRERVVFMELKTAIGKPTAPQCCWMEALEVAGEEVYLFRPADWPKIEDVLNLGQTDLAKPTGSLG